MSFRKKFQQLEYTYILIFLSLMINLFFEMNKVEAVEQPYVFNE
jgi:hypothetical protein